MPKNDKPNDDLSGREGDISPDTAGNEAAMAGLSAEEIAALAADDAEHADATDDKAEVDGDDAGGADDDPAPLQAASDAPAEPAEPAADPSPNDERGSQHVAALLPVADVSAIAEQLTGVAAQVTALDKAYDDGDIDFADYRAQERALADQKAGLIADQREAEVAAKMNATTIARTWEDNVAGFLSENQMFATTVGRGALNSALNTLYQVPENLTASHAWLLQQAANMVNEEMGISPATPATRPDPAVEAAAKRAKTAQDARSGLPKTLGSAPVAAEADTAADEFSSLDSLSGMALEQAVARMTPEQAERFARG